MHRVGRATERDSHGQERMNSLKMQIGRRYFTLEAGVHLAEKMLYKSFRI